MIYVVDCGTSWLEEIKRHLIELGFEYEVLNLGEIENYNFETCSGIVISGAPTLLTQIDLEEYKRLFGFIKMADVPILGICLGHQIMGILYGSEIHREAMIDKQENIEIVKQDTILSNIENNSLFREEHSEFITTPDDFDLLAKSETCDVEMMKHKSKIIYGVQFHPEVSGENGKKIFKNFLNLCNKN